MTSEQRSFGARMFLAFSNAARLHILERLAEGPASVNEIADSVGLKQSMTSQHLSVLLAVGAVVCQPNGSQRVYSLRGPRIARILELTEEFHEAHVESLRQVVARHCGA